jgi:hypothetical protein
MAVQYNPGIVTDGLVLCLDAANRKSYPGTGTASNDLSNIGNNGILVNGVSYSTTNNGIFTFDGTNDTINCGAASQIGSSLTALSVEVIVRPTTAATKLIAENGTSFTTDTFYLAQEDGSNFSFSIYGPGGQDMVKANFTYSTNTWYHLIGVWKSNIRNKLYSNGINVTTAGAGTIRSSVQNGNTNLFIGSRNNSQFFFSGDIALVRIYNIELSAEQVIQNFNALRGRFGI